MNKIIVDNVKYIAKPTTYNCRGCVGENRAGLCAQMPACDNPGESVIFVVAPKPKPRLWKSPSGRWICGLSRDPVRSPDTWGVAETPRGAFTIWKMLNHVA